MEWALAPQNQYSSLSPSSSSSFISELTAAVLPHSGNMSCIRPATPGFIVTLVATALLAVVSFCVPYFKSVYFLRADINIGNNHGAITFGTLGYCLELSNGTTCSSPSIGYQLGTESPTQLLLIPLN